MIISDAQYKMQGARSFENKQSGTFGITRLFPESPETQNAKNTSESFFKAINDKLDNGEKKTKKEYTSSQVDGTSDTGMSLHDSLIQQLETIQYLLRMLLGRSGRDAYDRFSTLGENTSAYTGSALSSYGFKSYQSYTNSTFEYMESESMSFSTSGRVLTNDGREIEFNIEVAMSRSFYQRVEQNLPRFSDPLMDPLVIHLDGDPIGISDQKFYFDLDGDGSQDEISSLMAGSSFLALDKNNDGTINDGNELFGTKTGNGFADLAGYDGDGNGWIDEADEIFDQLRIFTIGADGNQKLVSLKDAGIGAINLGSTDGDFSVKDMDNRTQAVIRKSGFFLFENGMPGLMHQVDFAMSSPA